jgi:Flp pilus assembly protein TadB
LKRDREGAQLGFYYFLFLISIRLVTSNWAFHDQTRDQKAERNFKELNKKALLQGAISSKVYLNIYRLNKNSELKTMLDFH